MEGLARYTGSPEEMLVIGAGMDGVMDTLTRLFLEKGDRTFIPTPTFSYYEILTVLAGAEPVFSPWDRTSGFRRRFQRRQRWLSSARRTIPPETPLKKRSCAVCWRRRKPSSFWTRLM